MKKFASIVLALVMVLTCVFVAACNNKAVRVVLYPENGENFRIIKYTPDTKLPTDFTNGDKVFGGWWYDKECKTTPFVEGDELKDGTRLYAKWKNAGETEQVTVHFVYSNGEGTNTSVTVDKDSTVTLIVPNSRENYTFDGWYTQPSGGTKWTDNMSVPSTMSLYARWTYNGGGTPDPQPHTHDFGSNYFMYVKCSVDNCNVVGRTSSTNSFKNDFTYTYTTNDANSYTNLYNDIKSGLEDTQNKMTLNELNSNFSALVEKLEFLSYQYDVASVLYSANSTSNNDQYYKNFSYVSSVYNTAYSNYCNLFKVIDDNGYGNDFFESEEDRQECLALAAMYGDSAESSNAADAAAEEYNYVLEDYMSYGDASLDDIYAAYGKFVNANNTIAKAAGYDNYMDYAYANVYYREYTPADVAEMRNYVKTYIAPLYVKLVNKYSKYLDNKGYLNSFSNANDNSFVNALGSSVFESSANSQTVINYIGEYFKTMNSTSLGIDFYKHCNDLFKNGNYFVGINENAEQGAYTMWVPKKQTSILYFGTQYSDAFTFVHEYGHYYNGVYNQSGEISMDHDETQSQGDEMMFLAWLKANKPAGVTDGYTAIELGQIVNIMSTVILASAVDEFEQAVYSNSYGTGQYKDNIPTSYYGELFGVILDSYGTGVRDAIDYDEYWMYVCVDSAAYYISYAMSALPSLELFVKSQDSAIGFNGARDIYFKLFTAVRQSGINTYEQALAFAGLDNPFEQNMYTTLKTYFDSYLS